MDNRSLTNIQTLHPKFRAIVMPAWQEAQNVMPFNTQIIVIEGIRAFEQSKYDFDLGRTIVNPNGKSKKKPMGDIITWATAGQSYHNYGLAFDFAMITNGKDDYIVGPLWMKVVAIMEKYGLFWGGDFGGEKIDEPHFENKFGHNWRDLLQLYNAGKFIPGTQYVQI